MSHFPLKLTDVDNNAGRCMYITAYIIVIMSNDHVRLTKTEDLSDNVKAVTFSSEGRGCCVIASPAADIHGIGLRFFAICLHCTYLRNKISHRFACSLDVKFSHLVLGLSMEDLLNKNEMGSYIMIWA